MRAGTWAPENDLQDAARSLCPAIDAALAAARAAGADHALVSGSGPTVVGLFGGAARRAGAGRRGGPGVRLAAGGRGGAGRRGVGGRARLMHPFPLAGAIGLAVFLVVRRRRLGRATLALGVLVVAGLALWGLGIVEPPNLTKLIEDVGRRLGKWTYLLVGGLAYLETGAFVGLVAPGESAVLIGGVVAGQGQISIVTLIALVWACAVAGDCTSYFLGRRLGRGFLERHGPKLKITEERLDKVDGFFERHGGATILIGRFIGLVRALAPFIAGASRMELRRFLPYDVLGAGLWSALFCLLGYFFWRSLGTVETYIGRGAAAFTALVVVGLAVIFAVRLRRDPELRARVQRRLDANPLWRRVRGLSPGRLGLELTTLLALASVGLFTFFWLASLLGTRQLASLDRDAFSLARPRSTRRSRATSSASSPTSARSR